MPKKIQECSRAHLISVPLPQHAASYTVISHQFVIDYSFQALANAGFGIVEEEYRCTADGQIAQGIYKLQYNNDPELSMMFAWTNSYNKQVKFKCLIGAYINQTGTVMTSGDMGTWTRKHVGTADTETKATIDDQVSNAYMYYNQLVSDKTAMVGITLNKRKQAQLLGVLFAEFQILTTEQASIIRNQMDRPSHVYEDSNSLWAFYNYVTISLQFSHPRTWMEDQRILHYFISTVGNFNAPAQPVSVPVPALAEPVEEEVDPLYEIPNQTNLLDQIAEAETVQIHIESDQEYLERVAEIEGEAEEVPFDIDEDDDAVLGSLLVPIEKPDTHEDVYEVFEEQAEVPADEIIQYTDPVGNTFEVPVVKVDTVDLNETTKMAVIVEEQSVSPCAAHDVETEKEEARIDLSDLEGEYNLDEVPAVIETIQERIDEAKAVSSLEPTPEEHALIEAEVPDNYVPWETDEDEADLDLKEPVVKVTDESNDDFDLDFGSDDPEDDEVDNTPDFF